MKKNQQIIFKNSLTIQSSINSIIHESPSISDRLKSGSTIQGLPRGKSKISPRVHFGRIPTVFYQREISMSKCTSRASMRCTYLEHRASYPPTICGTLARRGLGCLYLGDFNRMPFPGPDNAQYHPANFQVRYRHRKHPTV